MISESEHKNRQRSPQQAQGRKWPILVLLLGLAALVLALTACGGSSSTSTPGATTGSPPTATLTPASTPTPRPTEAAEVGETTGISRETREYIEALCPLQRAENKEATWSERADEAQKLIDFIEKNEPPEELRDYLEAEVAMNRLIVRYTAEQDHSLPLEPTAAWWNDPESPEVAKTFLRELEALDRAVLEVFKAGC